MARRRSRVLGMIMAGGKGERLHPLTRDRSKPAVPFGGRYRIVDFVLSNFVNSEMAALYVLVQYKSQSLIEHLRQAWRTSGILPDYFITVVPPQMRFGPAWYRGTADAVLQNLNVVDDFNPDIVAIFGADHVYRMDINQMLVFHEESGADVTVAAHMDLLGESPRFDLDNRYWPIRTGQHPGPPARFIGGEVDNVHVGEASLIKRATIRNSILGRSVWVNEGAVIEDSIVMDHTTVGKSARLKRAIVDRFNIIPADSEIGVDPVIDRRRHYVDPSGIVVVPRGGRREFLLGLEEF